MAGHERRRRSDEQYGSWHRTSPTRVRSPSLTPVSQVERPTTPWSVRVAGLVVLGLLGWLILGSAISVVRAVIALIGYIVVAVVAYSIGTMVGRRSGR